MCASSPKIPDPPPPPPAPLPPTKVADRVVKPALRKRDRQMRRGISALTIRRRPTINTGSSGSGANIY